MAKGIHRTPRRRAHNLYALYHVPPGAHPDYAAISALNLILGDTPSGVVCTSASWRSGWQQRRSFSQGLQDPGFTLLGLSQRRDKT